MSKKKSRSIPSSNEVNVRSNLKENSSQLISSRLSFGMGTLSESGMAPPVPKLSGVRSIQLPSMPCTLTRSKRPISLSLESATPASKARHCRSSTVLSAAARPCLTAPFFAVNTTDAFCPAFACLMDISTPWLGASPTTCGTSARETEGSASPDAWNENILSSDSKSSNATVSSGSSPSTIPWP